MVFSFKRSKLTYSLIFQGWMWNPQHNAWLLMFRYGIRMRIFLRLQERKMTMLWVLVVLGILISKNCKFQWFFFLILGLLGGERWVRALYYIWWNRSWFYSSAVACSCFLRRFSHRLSLLQKVAQSNYGSNYKSQVKFQGPLCMPVYIQ